MNYEKKAKELRQEILKSLFACQSGHPGGSLSCVEILMALYYDEMKNLDPKDPKKADRDRLVLSKGHACPTLYAILADLGISRKRIWHTFVRLTAIFRDIRTATRLQVLI